MAYVEVLADEHGGTTAGFFERAVAYYRQLGIRCGGPSKPHRMSMVAATVMRLLPQRVLYLAAAVVVSKLGAIITFALLFSDSGRTF